MEGSQDIFYAPSLIFAAWEDILCEPLMATLIVNLSVLY